MRLITYLYEGRCVHPFVKSSSKCRRSKPSPKHETEVGCCWPLRKQWLVKRKKTFIVKGSLPDLAEDRDIALCPLLGDFLGCVSIIQGMTPYEINNMVVSAFLSLLKAKMADIFRSKLCLHV